MSVRNKSNSMLTKTANIITSTIDGMQSVGPIQVECHYTRIYASMITLSSRHRILLCVLSCWTRVFPNSVHGHVRIIHEEAWAVSASGTYSACPSWKYSSITGWKTIAWLHPSLITYYTNTRLYVLLSSIQLPYFTYLRAASSSFSQETNTVLMYHLTNSSSTQTPLAAIICLMYSSNQCGLNQNIILALPFISWH